MKETSPLAKVEYYERQIYASKHEAQLLTQQIEKLKVRMNDEGLIQSARNVPSLLGSRVPLRVYNILKGHQNKIATVRWNQDSQRVLSVSQDGFLIIWNAVTGLKENAVLLDSEWVLTGAYSPNGRLALSAGLKNSCLIYNVAAAGGGSSNMKRLRNYNNSYEMTQMPSLQPMKTILKGHRCYISDCEFVDNNTILTSSGDLTSALWDIDKSTRIREYTHHLGDVLCLSLPQKNSNLFATGSSDGTTKIWDIRSSMPVQNFQVSQSDVTTLKFFPDDGSIGVGSDDGVARLFDLRADCQLSQYQLPKILQQETLKAQQYHKQYQTDSNSLLSKNFGGDSISMSSDIDTLGISSLDFSKSGRFMFVCYSELGCHIWDILKNEIVGELQKHNSRINNVITSPDGMAVCTSSWDATINVWSI